MSSSSSSYLSRHEIDDLRSDLDRIVYKVVGNSDATVRTVVESCLHNGLDRKRTTDKLEAVLDSRKAAKLYDRLEQLLDDHRASVTASKSSRKRTHNSSSNNGNNGNGNTNDEPQPDRGRDRDRDRDHRESSIKRSKAAPPAVVERLAPAVVAPPQPAKSALPAATAAAAAAAAAAVAAAAAASSVAASSVAPVAVAAVASVVPSAAASSVAGAGGGAVTSAGVTLTSSQIQLMMQNAQRVIEERKRAAGLLPPQQASVPSAGGGGGGGGLLPNPTHANATAGMQKPPMTVEDMERAKKIADLQAQIRAKVSGMSIAQAISAGGGGAAVGADANGALAATGGAQSAAEQEKPKPLILDDEGRTVDKTGRAIVIPTLAPSLKANIRAKKKEIFNKASQPAGGDHRGGGAFEEDGQHFHDDRIVAKPAVRNKRLLRFHEPGKFQQQAERMRMKAQLEKLQNEISQIARKTGISSATKLALIAPKQDSHADDVPLMEWWDSVVLTDDLNTMDGDKVSIRESAITNLIEHPTQMKPPNDPIKPVYMAVFLTKKERKKLRRQNRREAYKEEQEKIRIGLALPPEPKLRISNLMRVLGTEAVQDPTKIEAHVREQMAKRQKTHEDANNARKLTAEQKREKKLRKVKEDTSAGVHVSVYRIRELHDIQAKKFKVETNAKQLLMTGVVTLFRDCCVVVVEGGPKQQKKYRRLMQQRIKWDEDMVKNADGKEVPNSCVLVWEGTSQRRHFGEVKFKPFPMEKMAREFFQKHQVEHYWDLAYSGAVLEASEDV